MTDLAPQRPKLSALLVLSLSLLIPSFSHAQGPSTAPHSVGFGQNSNSPFSITGSAPAAPSQEPIVLDRVIAQVNDGIILLSQLRREVKRVIAELRQSGRPLPKQADLQSQVLERLVLVELQLQEARRAHIKISDATLDQAMLGIAKQNQLSLSGLRNALINEGIDYRQFREDIRQKLVIKRIRQKRINNRLDITEQDVERFMVSKLAQRKDIEYHLARILITLPAEADTDQIAAAEAKAEKLLQRARSGEDFSQLATTQSQAEDALKGGDLGWRTPASLPDSFVGIVPTLKKGEVSETIRTPAGLQILKLLDVRYPDKIVVEQLHARHILIKTSAIVSDRDAKEKLQRLRLRLEAGEDFALLARANSDDTSSAIKGGDLGWFSPGKMVPEFERQLKLLKINQISRPFKSPFGWHIAQLLGKRQFDQTDELLRQKAREQLIKLRIEEKTDEWLRDLRDQAFIELKR